MSFPKIVLLTLTLCLWQTLSVAQEHQQKSVINMAVPVFPPWVIIDESQEVSGISVDFFRAIAKEAGFQVVFTICPWKRCLLLAKSGAVDILSDVLKTDQREEFLRFFNNPYRVKERKVFYVHQGQKEKIQSFKDLKGLRIGVEAGDPQFPQFQNSQEIEKVYISNLANAFKMLETQRLDSILFVETHADYFLITNSEYKTFDKALFYYQQEIKGYFAMSSLSKNKIPFEKLNNIQDQLIKDKQLEQIIQHYLPSP